MTFQSVLFRTPEDEASPHTSLPACFADLHLGEIVDAIVAGKDEYDLRPFFYSPLPNVDAIRFRYEAMRDIEKQRIYDVIVVFSKGMSEVRRSLAVAKKSSYSNERNRWTLDAVDRYCREVQALSEGLGGSDVASPALQALHQFLQGYVWSPAFRELSFAAWKLIEDLSSIDYRLLVRGPSFTVRDPEGEDELASVVEQTFERFHQGETQSYLIDARESPTMNHIEAKVLDFVALLNPEVFERLTRFAEIHVDFIDPTVRRADRELQFYVAAVDYAKSFVQARLPLCFAEVSDEGKAVFLEDGFDLALAQRLVHENATVVRNSFSLSGPERVLVVSGPNQGGKTTFARTFGQMHYLAAIGCRVAGNSARTFLFDRLFTHFEREEEPGALRGKLEDDIIRIHEILEHATPRSIIVLNEIFASTTAQDACILATRVMQQILELDALCVCVTFIDELSTLSAKTVSVVSLVDPANPNVRTYKLERRPADGLAYAVSLAEKYGLTSDRLKHRIDRGALR